MANRIRREPAHTGIFRRKQLAQRRIVAVGIAVDQDPACKRGHPVAAPRGTFKSLTLSPFRPFRYPVSKFGQRLGRVQLIRCIGIHPGKANLRIGAGHY